VRDSALHHDSVSAILRQIRKIKFDPFHHGGVMMDLASIGRLGLQQLSSMLPEVIYLNTEIDLTRPSEIRATVTHRCNYQCLMCACWRFENYPQEISIDQWKAAFGSLKEFLGPFRVQFLGGEPFVKKGFLDLLEFCRDESISFGMTTNGSAFTSDRIVDRFVAARPLKIEISVDGPTPEVHDRLRGVPGSLESISTGMRRLWNMQLRLGIHFPIRIKATLNAVNFRVMPDLVTWAVDRGATTIDIVPIFEWTDESKNELWLSPADLGDLEIVIEGLLRMQAAGAPIETSEHRMRGMLNHFRREKVIPEVATCRIGLRVFDIQPDGRVYSCSDYGPLGDVTRQSAREIWTGAVAREVRRQTVACTKGCTYMGCRESKSLRETIRRGLMIFGRGAALKVDR
jgi:MoaA/NifB/PqqE/SkfB family radical SAM enzyme